MSKLDLRLRKVKEHLNIGQAKVRLTIHGDMELNAYLSKGYFKDAAEKQAYEDWVIKRKQEEDNDFESHFVHMEFDEVFFLKDIEEFRRKECAPFRNYLLDKQKDV